MYESMSSKKKEWALMVRRDSRAAVLDYVSLSDIGLFLILMPMGLLFPLLLKKN